MGNIFNINYNMPPKKGKITKVEDEKLLEKHPGQKDTKKFAVAHIMATKNDTFLHVNDATGRETYAKVTGGMKVKADREESSPYAAMMAANDIGTRLRLLDINCIHVKIRARGGVGSRNPGAGAQAALKALARFGLKIGRIEDVTPVAHDRTRRKGGRRGRRL